MQDPKQPLSSRQLPPLGKRLDPIWFDRLVDGELTEAERRTLLLRFDDEPDAWRQCALAFLESQAWQQAATRSALANSTVEACPTDTTSADTALSPVRAEPNGRWSVGLLMLCAAASLLVAFGGGLTWNGWQTGSPATPAPGVAVSQIPPSKTRSEPDLPEQPQQPRVTDTAITAPKATGDSTVPSEILRFVEQGADGAWHEVQVPTVRGDQAEAWMRDQPPVMPEALKSMLERMGHQIRTRRELMPVELSDGRKAWIPVDQIDVGPAANFSYQ